jgi:hypothetical protein
MFQTKNPDFNVCLKNQVKNSLILSVFHNQQKNISICQNKFRSD